jgi:hypothetical protein
LPLEIFTIQSTFARASADKAKNNRAIKQLISMKTKRIVFPILILFLIFFLSSCAPGNEKYDVEPAGFIAGFWHGLISLITFIISLFNDNVTIYEVNNSGKLYNLGYIIGIAIFYGGGILGSSKKR